MTEHSHSTENSHPMVLGKEKKEHFPQAGIRTRGKTWARHVGAWYIFPRITQKDTVLNSEVSTIGKVKKM